MAMFEEIWVGQLHANKIYGGGVQPYARNIIYLDPTNGSDANADPKESRIDWAVKTFQQACKMVTNSKHDLIYYVAGSSYVSLSTASYFSTTGAVGGTALSRSTFCGVNSGNALGNRSKIMAASASAAVSPMITIAGDNNYFSDLYWNMDQAHADNHNVATVSGSYNRFDRCTFGGPLENTQGADSAFRALIVNGAYNYFNHCVIGLDTAKYGNTAATNVLLSFQDANHVMNIFEDCMFMMECNGVNCFFIEETSTSGQGHCSIFKRCSFVNTRGQSSSKPTYAISWATDTGPFALTFDQCTFFGVSDIIATGNVSHVQFASMGDWTAANVGMNVNPAV